MREIKFRGIALDTNDWVYGYFVKYGFCGKGKHYIVPSYASALYATEVKLETVGKFTGLRDKHQRHEAYANDVLDTMVGNAVICFGEYGDHVGFYVDFNDDFKNSVYRRDLKYWLSTSEVIGNIHESPELIK